MKDKISKLKNVFKKYGFKETIKNVISYFNANYLIKITSKFDVLINKKKYEKEINKIINADYERIIIWRSSFGYNVPLFQRPQHIANNLSEKKCLIFYEVTTMTDKVKTIKKMNNMLYLVNFNNKGYSKILLRIIQNVDKPKYLEFYSTDWTLSIKDVKTYQQNNYKIIYEYIDDINPQIAGTKDIPKNILDKYNYAISNKDTFIVCSADILYNDALKKRGKKNLILTSNGVDYKFFKEYSEYKVDKTFMNLIKNGKINICYYGALAKWLDYKLIQEIDKTNKYNIIIFGVKYDDSYDKNMQNCQNVHFLGPKNYKVLKYYAKEADILIIPFLINDITMSTSPVKIFEYMALNKPIVTTNMNECQKYKSVLIGKTHKEFITKLEEAYNLKDDKKYINLLDKEAKNNDWSIKAQHIIDLIKLSE